MTCNVYDFDKTIFHGDSTTRFYFFCLRRYPSILFEAPRTAVCAFSWKLGLMNKTIFKENMYRFLRHLPDWEAEVDAFWEQNFCRMKDWYLAQKREDDLIISASPEFLLRKPCQKLNVRMIASRVDPKNGSYDGENCHGKEKVVRMRALYPDLEIHEFYSDSRSDSPLAELAEQAYLVKGNQRVLW